MQEVHLITAAGVELWAEVTGKGSPHVLVPGAGGDHSTWDPLWPQLTATNRWVQG
ncbi:alpha/beta fold hydrolase [Rhodococcus sp. NPDC060086]|uniref:alpha/beta fold hydrolase n=1 Tax=Rhodococcus sp. NPDC060086 TaxID=3347055 RepID=UPI00366835E3